MKADDKDGRRPLSEVLGYGPELSDALNRFSANLESRDAILKDYERWMLKCPHWSNICFADITFLPSSQDVSDALTIVLTAPGGADGDENYQAYIDALREYQANHHTIAAHEVFESGLPVPAEAPDSAKDTVRPSVASALEGFYQSCEKIENGLLMEELTPLSTRPNIAASAFECSSFKVKYQVTFDDLKVTKQFRRAVSEIPIEEHWGAWRDLFLCKREEGKLKSCSGRPMRWLAAIPVGYRHPYKPSNYELVSSIFLGFDDSLGKDQVLNCVRYLMLNQFEANATQMAVRQGVLEGKDLLVAPAAHELKYMTDAISIPILTTYFDHLLNPDKGLVSNQPAPFDLREIVDEQLDLAAKLERVALLSKRGQVNSSTADRLEGQLSSFADVVRNYTKMLPELEQKAVCASVSKYYFELALLAAFRNVVRHTWQKNDPEISITVKTEKGMQMLVIKNSFISVAAQAAGRAKDTGTLHAIRKYVQEYSRGSRYIEVKRVSLSEEKRPIKMIHEVWQTVVPLPELEGSL